MFLILFWRYIIDFSINLVINKIIGVSEAKSILKVRLNLTNNCRNLLNLFLLSKKNRFKKIKQDRFNIKL